jgi:hypothetical protein
MTSWLWLAPEAVNRGLIKCSIVLGLLAERQSHLGPSPRLLVDNLRPFVGSARQVRKRPKVISYSAMTMGHGHPSLRISLVKDAIDVVVRRLSVLPSSLKVEKLRATAEECVRVVDGWNVSPPATKESAKLMRRVLKLHVAVGKIERPVPET